MRISASNAAPPQTADAAGKAPATALTQKHLDDTLREFTERAQGKTEAANWRFNDNDTKLLRRYNSVREKPGDFSGRQDIAQLQADILDRLQQRGFIVVDRFGGNFFRKILFNREKQHPESFLDSRHLSAGIVQTFQAGDARGVIDRLAVMLGVISPSHVQSARLDLERNLRQHGLAQPDTDKVLGVWDHLQHAADSQGLLLTGALDLLGSSESIPGILQGGVLEQTINSQPNTSSIPLTHVRV